MPAPFTSQHRKDRLRSADGFVIIAVLWILATLAALVLIYSAFVTNTTVVVARAADRVQTDAVVTAAVELIYLQSTSIDPKKRPSSGSFNGRIGSAVIAATYASEASRIDLNYAAKPLLAGLATALGEAPDDALAIADRIIAWRSRVAGVNVDNDPEDALYQNAGMSYLPRHALFPNADELWLVQGLSRSLVSRMMPLVTVSNGRASINLRDAPPQVVAALPHMTPEKLDTILKQRDSSQLNGDALLALAAPDVDMVTLEGAKATRIFLNVTFDTKRVVRTEIVFLVTDDGADPYRVLSRRDVSEGEGAGRR